MANQDIIIGIGVQGDGSLRNLERNMQQTEQSAQNLGTQGSKSINNFTSSIKNAVVAYAGFTAVKGIITSSISAFDRQAKAIAKVEQAIKSTSGAAGLGLKQLQEEAANLQKNTIFGDEEILNKATAQLLTFTNIAGDNFLRTQKVALDLATTLGGDLQGASIQLGKALNDPVANLSALSRSGIQFSKEQKETIKALAETNQLAAAQGIILDELERQYGGQAEAATAGAGALQQFQNTVSDIQEEIGEKLIPIIAKLADVALTVLPEIADTALGVLDNFSILADGISAVGSVFTGSGEEAGAFSGIASTAFSALKFAAKSVISPLAAIGDVVSFVGGIFSSEFVPSIEDGVRALGSVDNAVTQFSAITGAAEEDVRKFADSFDKAKLAGLNLREATELVRAEFEVFRTTIQKTDEAIQTGPAAGSIAALQERLKGLETTFNETGSAAVRASLVPQIKSLRKQIELLNAPLKDKDKLAELRKEMAAMPKHIAITRTGLVGLTDTIERLELDLGNLIPGTKEYEAAQVSLTDANKELVNSFTTLLDVGFDPESPLMNSIREAPKDFLAIAESINYLDDNVELPSIFEQMNAAILESTNLVGDLKNTFKSAGIEIAQSIGKAIGAGTSVIDVLKSAIQDLLVEVPKMVGLALIQIAPTIPAPGNIAALAAGAGLLGLSGLLSGIFSREQEGVSTAGTGTENSATGSIGRGLSDFSGVDQASTTVNVSIDRITVEDADGNGFETMVKNVERKRDELGGR